MVRIGVLGPSDIAGRRFIPGVNSNDKIKYAGVACPTRGEWIVRPGTDNVPEAGEMSKAIVFCEKYGGEIFESYESLICSDRIDAVYVPLPPMLHYFWGSRVLNAGKHLLLEKPFTDSLDHTKKLIALARRKRLAVHENYAFLYHRQIEMISSILSEGRIGEVRVIRAAFGFPYRGAGDFRYSEAVGGGSVLDCGGYPLKLCNYLLGGKASIADARIYSVKGHDTDVFGNVVLVNEKGITAQIAFGMDNAYKCEVEIWGSLKTLSSDRVYSPPATMETVIRLAGNEHEIITVPSDDQFRNSALYFIRCIEDMNERESNYNAIETQAGMMTTLKRNPPIILD